MTAKSRVTVRLLTCGAKMLTLNLCQDADCPDRVSSHILFIIIEPFSTYNLSYKQFANLQLKK